VRETARRHARSRWRGPSAAGRLISGDTLGDLPGQTLWADTRDTLDHLFSTGPALGPDTSSRPATERQRPASEG